MKPIPAKPRSIMAQVESSGTADVTSEIVRVSIAAMRYVFPSRMNVLVAVWPAT